MPIVGELGHPSLAAGRKVFGTLPDDPSKTEKLVNNSRKIDENDYFIYTICKEIALHNLYYGF